MKQMIPVVLAGGKGKRLWPLSTEEEPKQFVRLAGKRSLFQETLLRAEAVEGVEDIIVVTHERSYFTARRQVQELGIKRVFFLLEPQQKGTAPALAFAALYVSKSMKKPALLLALPADHECEKSPFIRLVAQAARQHQEECITTFGVVPRSPATGYGYLQVGKRLAPKLFSLCSFIEKPPRSVAEQLFGQEKVYWNTGIFLCSPKVYLEELSKYARAVVTAVAKSCQAGEKRAEYAALHLGFFETCPALSIDRAIMEKTKRGAAMLFEGRWSDLGLLATFVAKEKQVQSRESVFLEGCQDALIHYRGKKPLLAVGIDHLVVLETSKTLLVTQCAAQGEEFTQERG